MSIHTEVISGIGFLTSLKELKKALKKESIEEFNNRHKNFKIIKFNGYKTLPIRYCVFLTEYPEKISDAIKEIKRFKKKYKFKGITEWVSEINYTFKEDEND